MLHGHLSQQSWAVITSDALGRPCHINLTQFGLVFKAVVMPRQIKKYDFYRGDRSAIEAVSLCV